MKHLSIYLAIFSTVVLLSCGSDDDRGFLAPNPVLQNEAPTTPKLVFPTDNLTCTSDALEFTWNTATDTDGDELSYVIEVAAEDSFTTILFTAVTTEASKTFTLLKGVTYYWRVKARDDKGSDSTYSATQSFFTEPEASINSLPSVPEVIAPGLGDRVSGSTVTLDWDASDADNDALVYDVYFGTSASPVLIEENLTVSELEVSVSSNTIYYWRVVVKDTQQNATMGQLWNFRTE